MNMKTSITVLSLLLVARISSAAEISRVFGPFGYQSSPSSYYNVYFDQVPSNFVGHCTQTNGQGKFEIVKLLGAKIRYMKRYKCTYMLSSKQEMEKSAHSGRLMSINQFGHSYYDHGKEFDPEFSNNDRDSNRHLTYEVAEDGAIFNIQNSSFKWGWNMDPLHYEGSSVGKNGLYFLNEVNCVYHEDRSAFDTPELAESFCNNEVMLELARRATEGSSLINVLGINSQYF